MRALFLALSIFTASTSFSYDDVVVAVLDTGIDYTHEQFQRNVLYQKTNNLIPQFINHYYDEFGHGTHIASVVSIYSGGATILPLKIATLQNEKTRRDIASTDEHTDNNLYMPNQLRIPEAIDLAIRNKAKILNISITEPVFDQKTLSSILKARSYGILIVASSGNARLNLDKDPVYPCSYSLHADNVVCVGYLNENYERSPYFFPSTNYGSAVNLYIKGENVIGASKGSINGYELMTGSSQGAAKVSGIMAQLYALGKIELVNFPLMKTRLTINLVNYRDVKNIILKATTYKPHVGQVLYE